MVATGDDAAALDAYGRAISDASTAAGRFAKARVLQRLGRADEALTEARKATNEATDERTAEAARNLVAAIAGPRRWNLRLMLGHQVDTNVVLLQTDERVAAASFAPPEISDRIGNRWTLTLGGEYRLPLGDGGQLGFGYSGYQSYHRTHRATLQRYDVGAHSPIIRYIWKRGRMSGTAPVRVSWTLLGPLFSGEGTDTTRTDLRLYSRSIDFAPSVAFALSETARLFGVGAVAAVDFTEPDRSVVLGGVETSLVRSNLAFSLDLGAAWTMLDSGELRSSIGLIRSEAWGLVNAWDNEGLRLRLRARTPDFGPVHVVLAGEAARRFYDQAYPVPDATNASGFAAVDRTDDALLGSITLRAGWQQLVGECGVTVQRNLSTVSLFDYRRTIVSVAIGAEL